MLHSKDATRFKFGKDQGVVSLDNSLLKHYGKCFDNIYYHYDYVRGCFCWSHDLVTLYYSDDQTDYPIDYQLWESPDWEAVAEFFRGKDYTINQAKWDNRYKEPQKWRNYIRSRYRSGRKKHPEVVEVYKTKLHIGEILFRKFCEQYPDADFPVALDSGYTSAEFCEIIRKDFKKDYVGSLWDDQTIFIKRNRPYSKTWSLLFAQTMQEAEENLRCKKPAIPIEEKKNTPILILRITK